MSQLPAAPPLRRGKAFNVFEVAKTPDLANRRVAEKRIYDVSGELWLLSMMLETYRKGVDPSYDPGHASFWKP